MILYIGTFLVGVLLGRAMIDDYSTQEEAASVIVFLYVLSFVLGWMYYSLQESGPAQATIGKRAVGLKVTDYRGNRIDFSKATGRYFGKFISAMILLIGFFMAGWTEKKQALHDLMAGTLVVRN